MNDVGRHQDARDLNYIKSFLTEKHNEEEEKKVIMLDKNDSHKMIKFKKYEETSHDKNQENQSHFDVGQEMIKGPTSF